MTTTTSEPRATEGTFREATSAVPRTRRPRRLALPLLFSVGLCLGALVTAAQAQAGAASGTGVGAGKGRDKATSTIIDSTRQGGRTLALTFDDGPNPADTPRLLRVLREHHVRAVFCLWGDHVRRHPELVRAIAAGGHTLCNHTMHHDDMSTWSPEEIRADLERTNAAIHRAAPGVPIRYFRAPYGSWGQTPEVAARLGMQPLGWRLAIGDWDPPGTDELIRRITEGITPGAVVLLHDGGGDRGQTVEAVDRIIPHLRAEGWRFDQPAHRG